MFGQVGLERLGCQLHVKFRGEKEREKDGEGREGRDGEREREKERERARERERERDRQTDRQTDRRH